MAKIWILGGGLIGCGWAVAFAGAGHETVVIDPAAETEQRLQATWKSGGVVLEKLGTLDVSARPPCLVAEAGAAGAAPDLVQECLPEDAALKSSALKALEPFLRHDTVIASSSSGLDPARIGAGLVHPERVVIAHPCNPPYLMPIVELSGSENADRNVLARAEEIYTGMGKVVLKLARPMPGHLVNRLQAALWREAISLAREGVASVGDIERAVTLGLAPRWCIVGPTGVFHLAGADGGIGRCIDQLGREIERWWEPLGPSNLDGKTRDLLVNGMAEYDPRPVSDIASERDRRVTALLGSLSDITGRAG